jgi:uncharacterized cofD-like protein
MPRLVTVLKSIPWRLRWLRPGLGIKRWLLLLVAGATLAGLGGAYLLSDLYHSLVLPPAASALTLQFVPRLLRAVLFGGLGAAIMLWGLRGIQRALLAPFVRPGQDVTGAITAHRRRGRGPKVVAIGGGTGLSTILRGLKAHTSNLTAIVTVADDGGSSGRLRRALGVLPPGDFRNCLAALAEDESVTAQLFQYRFGGDKDLGGHSFGNLFITAMAEVTGSFEQALVESSRVLAIRGQVLPSTLQNVTLVGELAIGLDPVSRVEGESQITLAEGAIRRVFLQPDDAPAYPAAIKALLEADLIALGPGSLYTSLLPNLLVHDLAEAIAASRALKVYVCNTATQPGETEGYSVQDHVDAIESHTRRGLFPIVLANDAQTGLLLPRLAWVALNPPVNGARRLLTADLADPDRPWRHDGRKTAAALMNLLTQAEAERSQPAGLS